ncbi:Rrna-processing fyv7 [Melia azedarach]|uniref:Rrna-processing fyv7 n=1 Tax=Melia azedarach TaxID=155640 RepID=A0ACC1YVW9_MELAZ|nr:Rrna-processing fyv7 [Melia azedarach]
MKRRHSKDGEKVAGEKKKKNLQRLGGTGLSLEAFANAKSTNKHYNPAFKKKQMEFYKNAKYVSKYKKSLKQQNQQNHISSAVKPAADQNQTRDGDQMDIKNKNKSKNKKKQNLEELYEKKRQEEEQARTEREAVIQTKKEEREKAEAQRKELRAKMFKKTRYGQPVMKYRIEHLLQTIQGSSKNSSNDTN